MTIWEIIWGALPGLLIFGGIFFAIVWKVVSFLWNGTDADVRPVIHYGNDNQHHHHDE